MFCDLMGCESGQNGLGMGRTELVLDGLWGILWKYLEGVGWWRVKCNVTCEWN